MESTETWHAERRVPAAVLTAPASELSLGYDVTVLPDRHDTPLTTATPLSWIPAAGVITGRTDHVRRDYVHMGLAASPPPPRRIRAFTATTNGLAAGNNRTEALVHGLYELVERDAIVDLNRLPPEQRTYVDPASVTDPLCAGVMDRILGGGRTWLEIIHVPGRLGVPTLACYVWSETLPVVIAGAGTHLDPAVALLRALTEAAQSRLTVITGTRDDIPDHVYAGGIDPVPCPVTPPSAPRIDLRSLPDTSGPSLDADLETVCLPLMRLGGEPLFVDLRDDRIGIDVVRVVAPGLCFDRRHHLHRPVSPARKER